MGCTQSTNAAPPAANVPQKKPAAPTAAPAVSTNNQVPPPIENKVPVTQPTAEASKVILNDAAAEEKRAMMNDIAPEKEEEVKPAEVPVDHPTKDDQPATATENKDIADSEVPREFVQEDTTPPKEEEAPVTEVKEEPSVVYEATSVDDKNTQHNPSENVITPTEEVTVPPTETPETNGPPADEMVPMKNEGVAASTPATNTSTNAPISPVVKTLRSIPEIKKGMILKQGHLIRNWKNRFFVVNRGNLAYYESQSPSPPFGVNKKGELNLKGITVSTDKTFVHLKAYDDKGVQMTTLLLDIKYPNERDEWVAALQQHIEYANNPMQYA